MGNFPQRASAPMRPELAIPSAARGLAAARGEIVRRALTLRQARRTLLAALLVLAALPAGAGAASCQPPASATYEDADVIVWTTQEAFTGQVDFVACWRATGRTVTALRFDNSCDSPTAACDFYPTVRRVVRAGSWRALYVNNQTGYAEVIALVDVRGGKTPRVDGYLPNDVPREMVLRRDGTLAWISKYWANPATDRFSRELRMCDTPCRKSGRAARLIAEGDKLSRLRLKRGRVYWSDGKHTHSARAR